MGILQAVKVDRRSVSPDVERVIRAAFPSWKGRRVRFNATESLQLCGMYWDGGSRSEYVAVALGTLQVSAPSQANRNPPQFGGPRIAPTVPVPVGAVIVEHVIFCGKDVGVYLHVNPANMPAVLPAPEGPEGKAA